MIGCASCSLDSSCVRVQTSTAACGLQASFCCQIWKKSSRRMTLSSTACTWQMSGDLKARNSAVCTGTRRRPVHSRQRFTARTVCLHRGSVAFNSKQCASKQPRTYPHGGLMLRKAPGPAVSDEPTGALALLRGFAAALASVKALQLMLCSLKATQSSCRSTIAGTKVSQAQRP